MYNYSAKSKAIPKDYEDSHASCVICGFDIEDNPTIQMIRIIALDYDCSNMFDWSFERNYFLNYYEVEKFIQYLKRKHYYLGNLYEAIVNKYGEYLENGMITFDFERNGISFIEDCYFYSSKSRYESFTQLKSIEELNSLLKK